MNNRANVYAQPLFSLCVEKGITHEMLYEIKNLSSVDDLEIVNVMKYPIISKTEKKELIDSLQQINMNKYFLNLLKLLIDFDDIHLISDIKQAYSELYQEKYGVEIIKVIFAKNPTSKRLDTVREMIENQLGPDKFVVIKHRVDPSLIGGVIIEYDGKVMDNSVKKHLKQLVNNL